MVQKIRAKATTNVFTAHLCSEAFSIPMKNVKVVDQPREIQYSRLMVTIQLTCRHCESENIVRNGMTSNGKQRFLCKDCGKRSRQNPQPNGCTEEEREKILRAYQERTSLRGLARTFGVSRNTVSSWLKKRQQPSRS